MNRCPKCGDSLPAGVRFCGKCGFPQGIKVTSAEGGLSVQPPGQSSPMTLPDNFVSGSSIVVKMNEQQQRTRNKEPRFWITVSLLICLIGGLGTYIASTYLFNPASGTIHVSLPSRGVQPTLSLQGSPSATIKQGQTLILHGEHFRAGDPISFLLDSTIPIKDKDNQIISVRASNRGAFDVSIPIQGSDWSANPHYIQGVDNLARQDAYLTIVVSPASVPETTSQNLALSMSGQTINALTFHAVAGQGSPDQQRVTLTNTSGSPLHWTVSVSLDHNLSWLVVDNNHLAGNLDINGTDSIDVGVLTTALKSNQQADTYTGQIVFTINGQEQLALPVTLQVVDPPSEVVFNPNPAVAILGAGNTCQATTFTLINLGNSFINWALKADDTNTENHIQFIADGQSITQGNLAPSGMAGDTQVLNLQCNGVSAGNSYTFTMYAGDMSWPVTINIQTSP